MAIDPFADPFSSHTSLDLAASSYLSRASTSGNTLSSLPDNNNDLSDHSQSRISSLSRKKTLSRRLVIFIAVICAFIIIATVLPIYLSVTRAKREARLANSPLGAGTSNNPESPTGATTGGDGSIVIMEDGTEFVYQNMFGGFCMLFCSISQDDIP